MSEEAPESTYHLSLKGPGITINKDVDSRVAAAIAQMTLGGVPTEARDQRIETRPALAPIPGQRLSLREYLHKAAGSGGIHLKMLAVARYMRDVENQEDFGREDVRSRFRSAGEPQPRNFPRDFQKAVRAGWIAEDHQNRGRYYVTRTGDEEIDRRGTEPLNATPVRTRRRRRRLLAAEGGEQ